MYSTAKYSTVKLSKYSKQNRVKCSAVWNSIPLHRPTGRVHPRLRFPPPAYKRLRFLAAVLSAIRASGEPASIFIRQASVASVRASHLLGGQLGCAIVGHGHRCIRDCPERSSLGHRRSVRRCSRDILKLQNSKAFIMLN